MDEQTGERQERRQSVKESIGFWVSDNKDRSGQSEMFRESKQHRLEKNRTLERGKRSVKDGTQVAGLASAALGTGGNSSYIQNTKRAISVSQEGQCENSLLVANRPMHG